MSARWQPFPRLRRGLRKLGLGESGTASVEFVLYVPLFLAVFMAAFESGLITLRHVMLERAVDISVRNLRLGLWADPTPEMLRDEICAQSAIIPDCQNVLLLELIPVDQATWTMPDPGASCVNRNEEIQPVTAFVTGGQNQLMLVKACAIFNPIFPSTGLGLQLVRDDGGYAVTAFSAFVNEPV
ncbi:hypothetical protein ABIE69_002529 [Rhodobacteraceae bacterium MBR-64]|jgi:hypothetical protein